VAPTNPLAVSFDEGSSCGTDEIGHLEGWPISSTSIVAKSGHKDLLMTRQFT
jgi:hypothetical protein